MWGRADEGFCSVTAHTCPVGSVQIIRLGMFSCAAPVQLHWAGYSQAPAITYFGSNCNVDNPCPTTPCHSPRSSCVLDATLRFPLCSTQGHNEGPVPGPSAPPGCHNAAGPVAVLGRSLVLISGVQRKLNAPWLHTEQLSWGFRPPPCKQLCAFRLFFFLNKV